MLLEELLEQEKREQEKQLQSVPEPGQQPASTPTGQLLSDHDFERLLRTDVQQVSPRQIPQSLITSPTHGIPGNFALIQARIQQYAFVGVFFCFC